MSLGTVGDEYFFDSYREIATSLVRDGRFALADGTPVIHRPPGYVPVLLLALPGSGIERFLFQIIHSLLGGAAVFVTYALGRHVLRRARAALVASSIVAFWPFLVWETKVTVPENLLVVLVPLFALALCRLAARVSGRWLLIAGGVAGYAAITHALYQVLIVAGVAAILSTRHPIRTRVASAAAFLLIAVIPVMAWSIRNAAESGYMGVAAGFGHHYWKGIYNHEVLRRDAIGYFRDHDIAATEWVSDLLRVRGLDGIESDAERSDPRRNVVLDRLALRHMLAHPLYSVAKTLIKSPLAWIQQQSPVRTLLNAVMVLPLLAGAAFGVARAPRELVPLWIPLILLNLAAGATFVEGMPMRYALPWIPLVAVLLLAALQGPRSGAGNALEPRGEDLHVGSGPVIFRP